MGKPLIIVESPAKAKTITKYLDNKFIVKASMGHVRDLPKNEIGVDLENNFTPTYVTDTSKNSLILDLKKLAHDASSIYLASDHDREGEAIAWHIVKLLEKEIKDKPIHRIVFNEITKNAIIEAINKPTNIDINKVDAQQARRILDRIVGYKISPFLWKLLKNSLSAGRVQSVALRLICEIDEKIKAFVPEEFWTIEAEFFRDNLPHFIGTLHQFNGKKIELETQEQANQILSDIKDKPSQITGYERKERFVQPPPPYITSTLQQDGSKILNFNGKKTMRVAQRLYEGLEIEGEALGLITYMRTDSVRISDEANEAARVFISKTYGKDKLNSSKRTYTNKNAAQDAHEAIRPTYPDKTPESIRLFLTNDEFKLYDLIWKRFIATQLKSMKLSTVNLDITCGQGIFKASGSVILDKGFSDIYPHVNVSTGENIHPEYALNDNLEKKELKGKQHFTKPPSYYTEAQLIKELETLGIGRPSTYASITNTILERKYVELKEKKFYPTDLGHAVNKFLVANFGSLFNVTFTAEMEEKLDNIEFGKQEWQLLIGDYYTAIKELMNKVDISASKKSIAQKTDIICDKCNAYMVIKLSKLGRFLACSNFPKCNNKYNFTKDEEGNITIIDNKTKRTDIKCDKCGSNMVIKKTKTGRDFLACSSYPKCKNAKNIEQPETGEIVISKPKPTGEKCDKCGSEMIIKNGRFGEFLACSAYPKCKSIKSLTPKVKCPECGEGTISSRKGKKGIFYSCSRYPDCKFITNHKPIPNSCSECGHEFLYEHKKKGEETKYVCPKCKNEFY